MRIFGSYYQFFDFSEGPVLGLKVSVVEFFKALCRYSTFDQIHLYIKSPQDFNKSKEILDSLEIPLDQQKRIFIFSSLELFSNLNKFDYELFLQGDPSNYLISYIRTVLCGEKIFPISCFVHALSPVGMVDVFLKSFLADFFKFDTYICPSQAVKEVLSQHFKRMSEFIKQKTGKTIKFQPQLVVAPLGVDSEKFKPGQKEKLRAQLKLPADKIIILHAGRLTPYYKMDLFPYIQIIKRVTEITKNKNLLFLIVGQEQEKGYAENLRKLVHQLALDSYVQIIEKFENSLIPAYFASADIFTSPSDNLQETFGLTPLEAMSSGLPVVISDWDGYKESITDGVEGFKIPVIWGKVDTNISLVAPVISTTLAPQFALAEGTAINIEKFAQALQKLIDNHNLRKKMGQSARQKILEKYSWKIVIKQYEGIWSKNKQLQLKTKVKLSKNKIWLENIPYFNFYKHYPTKILNNDTKVKATSLGQNYLETSKILVPDETIARLGHPDLMKKILEFCLNNYRSVEDILKNFKIKTAVDREIYYYQILFMLKHNLLTYQEK